MLYVFTHPLAHTSRLIETVIKPNRRKKLRKLKAEKGKSTRVARLSKPTTNSPIMLLANSTNHQTLMTNCQSEAFKDTADLL